MSQLAVAWCLKNESVNCLLLGATSVEQFKENIHALQVGHTSSVLEKLSLLCWTADKTTFFVDRTSTDSSCDGGNRAPAVEQAATPAHGIHSSDAQPTEQ